MGRSMAGHLLGAGHEVRVFSRTRERAAGLVERGAVWASSPGEAAAGAEVVVSMVGYPRDVEEVYLGSNGALGAMESGALAIDMTTSSPLLARRLAAAGAERGVEFLDAPVSGGDLGAREARLSIMVGGTKEAFGRATGILGRMGTNVVYQGPAGSGQHAKLCNQIAIAGGMVAIRESLAYAGRAGLDAETVLRSISAGAAGSWSMSNLAPRALRGDFAPGFFVKHFLKDMGIALESAGEMGLELPGLALARRLYEELAAAGEGDAGTQVLLRAALEGK